MARKSLDDILDGNDEPEVVETEEVEAAPEPQPRDESGKFAAKGVEPEQEAPAPEAEPPSAGLPKDVYEPLKAVRSENQQLKDQLESLRREIQQQQRPAEPAAPTSVWEDENAWGGQLVSTAVQQAAYQSRLQMSEMLMAEQHDDFGAIKSELVQFVGSNPSANQQVAESEHPWRTAYTLYKNQQTMQELGATDLESLKAKLREELAAEMQAQAPAAPVVPPSLSTKRSVAARTGPAWSGPTPLGDLIGN